MNKLHSLILVGALAWVGCGGGDKPAPPENNNDGPCANDFECEIGTFCIGGECLGEGSECETEDDCGLGRVCRAGHCVEFVPECTQHDDCDEGRVCIEGACVPGCRDDDDCNSGESCDPMSLACVGDDNNGDPCGGPCPAHQGCDLATQECVPDGTCEDDVHCEGEFVCIDGFCRPPERPCSRNNDCPETTYCNRETERCELGCRQSNECRLEEVCVLGQCTDPPECDADENEPNDIADQATAVQDGDLFQALTICEDDDWFGFVAFGGDEISIELSFVHDFGNLNMQLFRPNGQLLQQVAGTVDGERFDLELTETGTYTVRVHPAGRGVFTVYDLDVEIMRNCRDDDFEPNDQVDQAVEIDPGVFEERLICGDDDDWHRLQLYAGETLEASIEFVSSLGDLDLVLYDGEREFVERADTGGDREVVTYVATAPEEVYLHIPGGEELINGYTFTVDVTPPECTSDVRENDDEVLAATEVSSGDRIEGTVCAEDPDWFRVVLPPDVPATITLSHDYTYGDLDLHLFGADGETLVAASETTTDEELIEMLVDVPGEYFIRVSGVGRSQGSYTLLVDVGFTVSCPADDRFEPNDRLSESSLLNPPGRHGDVIMCDDDDWYRFQLQEGQSVQVYLLTSPGQGQLELDLLGPDATRDDDPPFHSSVGPSPTKRVRAPLGSPAGTWKVRVRRVEGESVPYSIRLFIYDGRLPLSCEFDDEFEPDDVPRDANRVQAGEVHDGIVCGDNADWFRIDAEAGEILNIRIDFQHFDGDVDATLHRGDPLRPAVRSSSMTDNEFLRFQATSDGPIFVEVVFAGDDGGNTYSLLLSRIEGPRPQSCVLDDQFEQNDDFANATVIDPGVHSAIRCSSDADYYGVDLEEGQVLRATIGWGNDVPLDFDLFGPGNVGVATAEDGELPARQIVHQAQSSGRYALAVTSPEAGDSEYTLRYEALDGALEDCGPTDALESNDSMLTATEITEDGEHPDLSVCGIDEDWFRVTVPARASLLVEAIFDGQAGDLEIEAFAGEGGPYAASYGDNDTERLVLEAARQETSFLVRVFLRDGAREPLRYDMGFYYAGVSGCAPDANEPNESRTGATTVTPGTYDAVTLCPDDVDWYAVQTNAFDTVEVRIDFEHDEHNLGVLLYDPNFQTEVARSDGNGNTERVTWPSILGGPIYIQVFGRGENGTGYSMIVSAD